MRASQHLVNLPPSIMIDLGVMVTKSSIDVCDDQVSRSQGRQDGVLSVW